jgi:hypothetical protein
LNLRGHGQGCLPGRAALLILLAAAAAFRPAAGQVAEVLSAEAPEEIIVYGKSLADARIRLHRAEERVFSLFNSLNSDDEYDIHCDYQTPIGTLIRQRFCAPNFVATATSAEAFALMMGRPAVPAVTVVRQKSRLLIEEMRTLAAQHPQLLGALDELADAKDGVESLKEKRRAGSDR